MAKKKRLYALYYEKAKDKNTGSYLSSINKETSQKYFTKDERKAMIFMSAKQAKNILKVWNNSEPSWFMLLVTGGKNKFAHLMGANPELPLNMVTAKKFTQLNLL